MVNEINLHPEDIKEILNNYPSVKETDFKDNSLTFQKRLSQIIKIEDFVSRAFVGQSRWADNPGIDLIHESFDNPQEALTIEYILSPDDSTVQVSVMPRLEDYSEYISLRQFLIGFLQNLDTQDFKIADDSYSILSKRYSYDDLNDLKDDLELLTGIYMQLLSRFNYFIDDAKGILKEDNCLYELRYEELSEKRMAFEPRIREIRVKDIEISYPEEKRYDYYLNNPNELLTDENVEKILRCDMSIDEYRNILLDITQNAQLNMLNTVKKHNLNINELDAKDKILLFSKSFTKTGFKSVGRLLGSYSFGEILVDDRLSDPMIITSIIHELAHFILEKILKEVLMKILMTNDTPLVSSYVKILLEDNDLNYLLDEFCAHTVEGRFALYGFQDYSSFNYKLDEISDRYQKDEIDYALLVANTFAYDIKDILEKFIDDDLREDIKKEFLRLSSQPNYEPLDLEIESRLEDDNFLESIALILTTGIGEVLANPDKLERYMNRLM